MLTTQGEALFRSRDRDGLDTVGDDVDGRSHAEPNELITLQRRKRENSSGPIEIRAAEATDIKTLLE